ncbi:NAD-dependent epimerase/dehydratase family protein [Peribacillus acanthi]|uniref:NAD-dependent epimerase/dehydratase family protein n=1 Tax=Peribacillus acanthi TaxID=2171554 RepID=UPI000D3E695E|nr:NAD-dependent epimerase/dehydratase family protein [Peribacillus acanthi]
MKVLITGGAGFIGSFIVEEVLKRNWQPIVVDNFSAGNPGFISVGIPIYNVDIRSSSLEQVFQDHKPSIVIHQAAQVSVGQSKNDPLNDCQININGTLNLLNLCVKYQVRKFIFASSAAVYGESITVPISEESAQKPISFYGLSKYSAEQYIQLFHQNFGLSYTILRYSNVFGMRQKQSGEAGVISIFVNRMIRKQPIHVFGNGNQTRDFVFVRDVAKANVLAMTSGDQEILNICTNQPISINELISQLQQFADYPLVVHYKDRRVGDIETSYLSFNRAQNLLNWRPETSFEIGLKETVEYFSKELEAETR